MFDRALVRIDHRGERANCTRRRRTDHAGHDVTDAIAVAVAVADRSVDAVADAESAAWLAFDAVDSELAGRSIDAELAELAVAIAR